MVELEAIDRTEIVAVYLVREWFRVFDDEPADVTPFCEMLARCHAATAQCGAETAQNRQDAQGSECQYDEPSVEGGSRRQIEWPVPEVGVRVRVEHDREVPVVDHWVDY